jgi:hypothetical protein
MSGPPVKTKRAGDLAATSPNCFELGDHSAIVCSAQTWCEHADTRIAIEPEEQPPEKESARPGRKQHLVDSSAARFSRQERSCLVETPLARYVRQQRINQGHIALERKLRKLQEQHGRVFWRLEQLIGRIDDELERRRA